MGVFLLQYVCVLAAGSRHSRILLPCSRITTGCCYQPPAIITTFHLAL